MLDNCTLAFGTLIENALQEEDEIGIDEAKQRVKRYSLKELLDPEFRLPRPVPEEDLSIYQGIEGIVYDEV